MLKAYRYLLIPIINIMSGNVQIFKKAFTITGGVIINELFMSANEFKITASIKITLSEFLVAKIAERIQRNLSTLIPKSDFKLCLLYFTELEGLIICFEYKSPTDNLDYPNEFYAEILNILFKNIRWNLEEFKIEIPRIHREIKKITLESSLDSEYIISFTIDKKYIFGLSEDGKSVITTLKRLKIILKLIDDFCISTYFNIITRKDFKEHTYATSERLGYSIYFEELIPALQARLDLSYNIMNQIVKPLYESGTIYKIMPNLPNYNLNEKKYKH